jgi:phosphoserine phosphatase RsbU/P
MVQILVIDDDPAIQVLLKRTLIRQGYQVSLASDGEEGLEKAKEICPGLIICDWMMPKMNGLEVCRQVKVTPELSTTFFILLTSLGSIEDRVKGLDTGADDFLSKPIDMHELQARVRAGLRLHQLSSDLQKQKRLLEIELSEAAEYVCSILPEPLNSSHVKIDVCFIPSRRLGGDIFDYYWLDSDHLVMYLLDVAGHGLRAALPSLSVINLLRSRELMKVNYYQPSDVLRGLNEMFPMTLKNDKYFTIWYGVYNIKNRQLVYASAGHPPGILFSLNKRFILQEQALKTRGFPIGMFPESKYQNAVCNIQPHSCLYVFSDGIYELEQANGTIWDLDEFIKLLKEHQATAENDLDHLLSKVRSLNYKDYFDDDLSIMKIDFF